MNKLWPIVFTGALLVYPAWLGSQQRGIAQITIFVAVFAVALFFFGPKSQDVEHNPSNVLMALFSLVLATGLAGIGYFVGYVLLA